MHLLLLSGLMFSSAFRARAEQERDFWLDNNNQRHSFKELQEIVDAHKEWLETSGQSGGVASLVGADLRRANLFSADLRRAFLGGANLNGARLSNANLSNARMAGAQLRGAFLLSARLQGADLNRTDFRDADLTRADLSGADLTHATLADADLFGATLRGANLHGVDMSRAGLFTADLREVTVLSLKSPGEVYHQAKLVGANLRQANLRGAKLLGVDLSGARLDQADLRGTIFEPSTNPAVRGVAAARHLELLTYQSSANALQQLRSQFSEAGFQRQERQVTYALNRRESELQWEACAPGAALRHPMTTPIFLGRDAVLVNCGAYFLKRILFDLTCQYGMSPGRPLALVGNLWLLCVLLYALFIHHGGPSGLCLLGRRRRGDSVRIQGLRIRPRPAWTGGQWRRRLHWLREEWRLLRLSMLFSLMTALNPRLRIDGFGHWLLLPARRDYGFRAEGWARTVAGLQSLISAYLLALSILTYFAQPF